MSVAEAAARRTPHGGRPRRFLRSELRLIFRRRRNLAGLLVLAAVPVLIADRGQGLLAGPRAAADPTSSARSPRTACSSRWPR